MKYYRFYKTGNYENWTDNFKLKIKQMFLKKLRLREKIRDNQALFIKII